MVQHLAALWGLSPLDYGSAVPAPGPPERLENGDVDIGAGPILRTRASLTIRLPDTKLARAAALAQLEAWAGVLLSESYETNRPGRSSVALRAYYILRPFMPRGFQLMLRRRHARMRGGNSYLRWPFDGLFAALAEAYLALRIEGDGGTGSIACLWPEPFKAAAILTHDVEGPIGQKRCAQLSELEAKYGFRSCFNFVAERYRLDHSLMAELRQRGYEIGVHGIKHDGKKFSSRATFDERLAALRHYQREWNADGFRSPATHRKWEWMPELPFLYDSSYPDTDPYEPIPGGCGSPWPFMLGSLVELPITLPQDHTLWEILRQNAVGIWLEKASRLRACQGLVNIIVHPDYLSSPARWREYEEFLAWLRSQEDIWTVLPKEVAAWWKARGARAQRVTLTGDSSAWHLDFH